MSDIIINLTLLGKTARGFARFAQELLHACEENSDFQEMPITYLFGKGNHTFWDIPTKRKCYYAPNIFSVDKGVKGALARYLIPVDLFIPGEASVFIPCHQGNIFAKKQIITIHDLIPLKYSHLYKKNYYVFKLLMPIIIHNALHIITVSEATKKSIQEYYRVKNDKITVVYNGVDSNKFKADNTNNKKNILLVVGAYAPHKNIHELILNNEMWRSRYELQIIGGDSSYSAFLKELCLSLGLSRVVKFINWVDEETLTEKYRQARALIYPSFEEGFGIPLIEAMSSGTPVMVSDIPVHREVCGEAGIYIKLGDKDSWKRGFEALSHENIYKEFIDRGLARAKLFSWEKSAERLIEVLKLFL